ncbi:sirohydrochlorin chelatase [Streptomyces sp. JJ66]|uniref:sirohydrochlorin chelatase n=1 Tax=Streptomyces sp. JJ66 TaxID=2803843 RepID=UPI001C56F62E|nr:sirohydrochlorin chelatase [Streptomyces sp. JJ66]MBW1600999.1 sirohydrochlorin chelatase [Streptomyces sp. JJ66]
MTAHPTTPHVPRRLRAPGRPQAPTLVAVAHGSRDPRALTTVRALLDAVRELRPGLRVELGHIELNEPLLPATLAAHPPGAAVLVPLLFGRGYHVHHDLPEAARAARHLRLLQAAPLGPHPLLAEALHARLAESRLCPSGERTPRERGPAVRPGHAVDARTPEPPAPGEVPWEHPASDVPPWTPPPPGPPPPGLPAPDAVVLAAAGSRDPRSATDAEGTAHLLSQRLGGTPVVPAYASAAAPTVPDAVAALRAAGHRRIVLASYFTAPGFFATRCARDAGPDVPAAAPLGPHPALARLVLHRYDEALAHAVPAHSAA